MKKHLIFIAALCMASAVVSCEKADKVIDDIKEDLTISDVKGPMKNWWAGYDETADLSVFTAPANASNALLVEFASPREEVVSIEFTESSRYILRKANGTASLGNYTFANGKYTAKGFGTVALVDDSSITIDGAAVEAKLTRKEADELTAAVARSWKLYQSWYYLKHEEKTPLSDKFSGNFNFDKVAEKCYYTYKMTDLMFDADKINSPTKVSGYTVKEVIFTANGSFAIVFTGADPYVGTWKWKNEKEGLLSYTLNGGNFLIPAEGDAYVTPTDKYFMFALETTFHASKSYWDTKSDLWYGYFFLKMVR